MTSTDITKLITEAMEKENIECPWILSIGEFTGEYGTLGCFQKNGKWFVFWNDERNNTSINGPLSDEGLIFVLVHELHITGLYEQYSLSDDDCKNFRRGSYCSMQEVENAFIDNSASIFLKLDREILDGRKIPHSMSRPVIRKEGEQYYLAVFVFYYNRTDVESGAVNRPTLWAIADIKTGTIVEMHDTKNKDFSDAPYGVKYNIRSNEQYDTSKSYYEKAFAILDSVREKIIKEGVFDKEAYRKYLDMILKNIPEAYQRFYTDLSL